MAFAGLAPRIGLADPGISYVPSTDQLFPLGARTVVLDPYWGRRELIYLKAPASIVLAGEGLTWDVDFLGVNNLDAADTNLSYPIAIAVTYMAASTFGWFLVAGTGYWNFQTSVAINTLFSFAAAHNHGQFGTYAAGAQILGARILAVETGTFDLALNVPLVDTTAHCRTVWLTDRAMRGKLIPGMYLATTTNHAMGTKNELYGELGTNSDIASISDDGAFLVLTVDNAYAGNLIATGHYHNQAGTSKFEIVVCDNPFVQGDAA